MAARKKTRNPFSDIEGDLVRAVKAERAQARANSGDYSKEDLARFTKPKTNSGEHVAPKEPTDAEHNAKFKVMEFKPEPATRVEVYLLPPFASFRGFGGSRSGLMVGKTPSLVVRTVNSGWGSRDVEYDLADQPAWEAIVAGHKAAVMLEWHQN